MHCNGFKFEKLLCSNRNVKSSWSSVLQKWGSWWTVATAATKVLQTAQVEQCMGKLFLLEIGLDWPLLSQNKQLRGFIPGIALIWIHPKLISCCLQLSLDPPINSQNWISYTRLDHLLADIYHKLFYCPWHGIKLGLAFISFTSCTFFVLCLGYVLFC